MKKTILALCAFIVMGYVHAERSSTPDGLPELFITFMTHDLEIEDHLNRSDFIQGFNPSNRTRDMTLKALSIAKRTAEGVGIGVLAYGTLLIRLMPEDGFQLDGECPGNMTLP